jgi:PAS domain S-box-containing protein
LGDISEMALLCEKGVSYLPHVLARDVSGGSWKHHQCHELFCPHFKNRYVSCCRSSNSAGCGSSFPQKVEQCFACPVFMPNAENDSHGRNHVVSDEAENVSCHVLKAAFQKERDLLQILDNLPDGLFTWDKEGNINYFNAAAERIAGISASDALGLHCKEIFKETTCQTGCTHNKGGQKGKNNYNKEFVVTTLSGRTITITSSISVLKDHYGNVMGGVQVFKDTSDRKRLEDDLRLSETKYRRIFEGSKDMIFITSKEGSIRDVNQAALDLLGYGSKEELLSLFSVEEVYDTPMHWHVFKKQIDRYGFVKDFEAGFKRKDGTRMHCLLSGNAVRGETGEIVGYEGIVKDITARMDAIRNLQQRHRELSLLNAVALSMNATQDLDYILMTALQNVLDVLNLTSGGIFLIDHAASAFSLGVQKGLSDWVDNHAYELLLHDQSLMRALLKKDLSLEPKSNFPAFAADLKVAGLRGNPSSLRLTCFLITAREKASGLIALHVPSNRDLTEQDFHLLGSLGNFLGGAIENTRLIRTVHKHREELKGLTAKLFQSQEVERRRIARELHDEAGQALTGINFTMETIEKSALLDPDLVKGLIADVKKQINRTYQEMRRLSYRLHPPLLSDLGLEPALDAYLTRISKHSELNIEFKMVGFEERLDRETETVLYRLSQEALTNTLKHANAENFRLSIIKSYPHIIFAAEDDGSGFDCDEVIRNNNTLGLLSMRERASMLGGEFSLRSSKGKGTRLRIGIPINGSSHAR